MVLGKEPHNRYNKESNEYLDCKSCRHGSVNFQFEGSIKGQCGSTRRCIRFENYGPKECAIYCLSVDHFNSCTIQTTFLTPKRAALLLADVFVCAKKICLTIPRTRNHQ